MKTNKSLNELFHSASAEADGHVPSQNDVERLLRNSHVRSVPVTTKIGQRLYVRLLSTPLKIGITSMTTAACITLGIIAFLLPGPQRIFHPRPLPSDQTYRPDAAEAPLPYLSRLATHKSFVASPQRPTARSLTTIATLPGATIATSDSLHPIDLSEAQLAKLGVVLQENGDIDFYVGDGLKRDGDTGYVSHYGFNPSGGFRIHFLTRGLLTKRDLPQLHILSAAPKLITATNGDKRLFTFENDGPNSIPRFHTEVLKSFAASNGRFDVLPVFDDDSAMQASINAMIQNPGRVNRKFVLKQVKEIDSSEDGSPHTLTLHRETVKISDSLETTTREQFDTILPQVNAQAPSIKKETDAFAKRHNKPNEVSNYSDSEYNAFIDNPDELNRLIPIRVRNLKNPDHPNELIFWYDPTSDVMAAIPQAQATHTAFVTMQVQTTVYPNPTRGRATLHFELTGASSAHYTVRNLLGQEVMSGGTLSGSTGDIPLDLSRLNAGVYLLVTTTNSGAPDVERVVVAK
ncbi:MAG: T9SS type A sorting domain-containing protein [Candidatus Kapaibacterium sp.]